MGTRQSAIRIPLSFIIERLRESGRDPQRIEELKRIVGEEIGKPDEVVVVVRVRREVRAPTLLGGSSRGIQITYEELVRLDRSHNLNLLPDDLGELVRSEGQ